MEPTRRYTIKNIWAREKNIPATFIAVATRRTQKAIQLTGQGTLDARGQCMVCGRELTHPVSILTGIGPECGKHFWDESVLGPYGFTEDHARQLKQMALNIRFKDVWLPLSAIKTVDDTKEVVIVEIAKEEDKPKQIKQAVIKGNQIHITFPFDVKTVAEVKTKIEGRRWEPNQKIWTAPATLQNAKMLKELEFEICSDLKKLIADHTKDVAGTDPVKDIDFGHLDPILRNFQKAGVEFIEECNGNALVADEMGLGKTIQALAWLDIHPEIRPAVIIVPASLKLNWKKEIGQWMRNKKEVYVCSGRTVKSMADFSGFNTADIFIINYDILTDWWINQFKKAGVQAMVLDESHYIKNSTTKRAKAVKKLHRIVKHTIALSGTPITNRPIEFYTTIKLLAPQLFGSRFQYAMQFCNAHNNGYGWNFSGAKNTKQLHEILTSSIMVRRLKADVLKELPAKVISVVPMEINNRATYQKAEDNFIKYLREIDPAKAKAAERAETLVQIEHMKQLTIQGKMKACKDWIQDHIDTNGKLVVFCTHKSTIDLLMEEFKDIAVKLDGSTSQADRQIVVDRFQNDENVRLFVGNIQAAGVGITLTAASSVAFLELPWTPGACVQAEDRIHRIGQEASSCNIYYLLADQTIENEIADLLDQKRKILDSVLDGVDTDEASLLSELLNVYREN